MKTIDEIRRLNLIEAIKRAGTATRLAETAGLSAAYLSQIKNKQPESKTGKPKSLGDEAARKIERAIGETRGWMDVDHATQPGAKVKLSIGSDQTETKLNGPSETSTYNVQRLPTTSIPVGSAPARPVYVVGRANGGLPERIWTDGGYLVGATEEYAVLATDDPYAFLTPVIGTSMAPVYNPGDFAFVEPGTEVDLGDDVLVRLATGETMLKRLLVRRGEGVQLGSYGEPGTLFFKPEEITWIYYVAHPVRRKKIKSRF
ncbi:helix-turn-helix transcriptional regulator [Cupriavidus necator]|jgi:phage repressor protein C with HTH and peptisase S24 domain|uniref:helix-turn-helix transcriptional regulator n=1 Tax=Cupriavidus necator TaxID=106590 RepID=UPI0014906FFD|nr:helix-turn-helix transcriptional regulator [Cupriavidus necator]